MTKKIGSAVNFRLAKSEDWWVEYHAKKQGSTKAALIREILTEYTRDPAPLASAFVERIKLAIVLKESREPEGRVQVNLILPEDLKEALKLLSTQTGASIETLVSLMIGGHMLRVKSEWTVSGVGVPLDNADADADACTTTS